MITAIIQFTIYALIFYGGYRLLRHHMYARGGELPDMHPGAFLQRYYESDSETDNLTTAQRLRLWVEVSEAAEKLPKPGDTERLSGAKSGVHLTGAHQIGIHQTEAHQTGIHQTRALQTVTHQIGVNQTGVHQTGAHQTGVHQTGAHQTGASQSEADKRGDSTGAGGFQDQTTCEGGSPRREKSTDYPAKVLVCLGDSITHGRCSDDYVKRVRDEIGKTGWEVVNAGINGDTAWNMLQRLDDVIACEPDAVTILAGTNDVSAIQTPELTAAYRRSKSIPEEVTLNLDGYIGIMRRILEQLQQQTRAEIAVFTIPMIGEVADDAINRTVKEYNAELVLLCKELGVTVLELHEAQHRIIESMHRGELPSDEEPLSHIAAKRLVRFPKLTGYETKRIEREIEVAPYKRFVLMQSWQKIADSYGYYTLIDGMHLNDRGGMAAAGLLLKWMKRSR